jgi:hypothetical protein
VDGGLETAEKAMDALGPLIGLADQIRKSLAVLVLKLLESELGSTNSLAIQQYFRAEWILPRSALPPDNRFVNLSNWETI